MVRVNKKVIIVTLSVLVLIMVIGYATFSTNLKINGTANIASEWNIVFTKIEILEQEGTVEEKTPATAKGTSATFNVDFKSPGDYITYRITVENKGTLNAIISNIKASQEGSSAINFELDNINIGDKLAKGTSTTFTVKISYKDVTEQPQDTVGSLTVESNYVQDLGQVINVEKPEIGTNKSTVLAKRILEDNIAQSDSNIDFSQVSSDSNGKGLYFTNKNTEDNKVTYYFRGAVDNNYVYFAGYYWRIIRINEDGSIRMIYQGESADATGEDATIGSSQFNEESDDNAYVGFFESFYDIIK